MWCIVSGRNRKDLDVRGGNCEPMLISLSRRREREIEGKSTSRTNHYFRHEHLVRKILRKRENG